MNMHGYDIAFNEINLIQTILPNFQLSKIEVQMGQTFYIPTVVQANILALQGEYGVAIVGLASAT